MLVGLEKELGPSEVLTIIAGSGEFIGQKGKS
jgi:hypothetical protein